MSFTPFDSTDFELGGESLSWRVRSLLWLLLAATGVGVGLAASLLTFLSRALQAAKSTELENLAAAAGGGGAAQLASAFLVYLALSTAYGGIAAALVAFVEPAAAGSGIPEVKAVLNGVDLPSVLTLRTLATKVLGLIFAVSSGLPVGKEGPMIHSGAIFAAALSAGWPAGCGGRWVERLHWHLRSERQRRDMIVCGSAAGVAAAFGAPVGGVLFAIEEGASFWYKRLTWRSFFCAVVSAYTVDFFLSGLGVPGTSAGSWGTLGTPGMFSFGAFPSASGGWKVWELPLVLLTGALGGLVGAAFVAANRAITVWRFTNIPVAKPWRRFAEVIAVVAAVASLKFWLSRSLDVCIARPGISDGPATSPDSSTFFGVRFLCPDGHYGDLASLLLVPSEDAIRQLFHFTSPHAGAVTLSVGSVAVFFLAYTVLAVVAYGIAVPAGLFIPSLLSGAAMGRLIGEAANVGLRAVATSAAPAPFVDVGFFSLLGAAAVLGGNTRMVISLGVIIMESTGAYQFALPLMCVLFVARWVGNALTPSIYDLHTLLRHVPVLGDSAPRKYSSSLQACDVMSHPLVTLREVEDVGRVLEVLSGTQHNAFPVESQSGSFSGLIGRRRLAELFSRPSPAECNDTAKAHLSAGRGIEPLLGSSAEATQCPNETPIVNLRPLMDATPFTVVEDAPLSRAFRLFRHEGLRHLVVVNRSGSCVGVITRDCLSVDNFEEKFRRKNCDRTVAIIEGGCYSAVRLGKPLVDGKPAPADKGAAGGGGWFGGGKKGPDEKKNVCLDDSDGTTLVQLEGASAADADNLAKALRVI